MSHMFGAWLEGISKKIEVFGPVRIVYHLLVSLFTYE